MSHRTSIFLAEAITKILALGIVAVKVSGISASEMSLFFLRYALGSSFFILFSGHLVLLKYLSLLVSFILLLKLPFFLLS